MADSGGRSIDGTIVYLKNAICQKINEGVKAICGDIDTLCQFVFLILEFKEALFGHSLERLGAPLNLFVDEDKDKDKSIIDSSLDIYTSPSDDRDFSIPDYVGLKFINSQMYKTLSKMLEITRDRPARVFCDKFEGLINVSDYDFSNITEKIIGESNKKADATSNPKEKEGIIKEMVRFLFRNYTEADQDRMTKARKVPYLIAQSGKIRKADELYFPLVL